MTPDVLLRACTIGGHRLRTLDAIHLASATAVAATAIRTFDERLADSAAALGLSVSSPA